MSSISGYKVPYAAGQIVVSSAFASHAGNAILGAAAEVVGTATVVSVGCSVAAGGSGIWVAIGARVAVSLMTVLSVDVREFQLAARKNMLTRMTPIAASAIRFCGRKRRHCGNCGSEMPVGVVGGVTVGGMRNGWARGAGGGDGAGGTGSGVVGVRAGKGTCICVVCFALVRLRRPVL